MKVAPHTALKHRMLGMYFMICRQVAKTRWLYYVDLYAGDGEAECDEAPIKKWKCPFIQSLLEHAKKGTIKLKCFLNELDPDDKGIYERLKQNVKDYKKFIWGLTREDANKVYVKALKNIPKDEWSIFFLDPSQHDHLAWKTIEEISKHEALDSISHCNRKPELIINLMTYTMQRAYKHKPESITLALGTDEWKDRIISAEESKVHEIFSEIFIKRLEDLGYTVNSFQITQTLPHANVLYYMIFASSIPNANEIIVNKYKPYIDKQLKDKWTKENFKCRLISKARKQGNTLVTDY